MGTLDGKVVLISGTARGQGRAAALAFAAAGAKVFGCDVLVPESEETLRLVQAAGGEMRSLHPHDVSDFALAQAWAKAAHDAYGRIDVLYNNAGSLRARGRFGASTMEEWDLTIRYELTIVYASTRAAWPYLIDGGGVILSTGSISGHVETHPLRSAAHGATKAGVIALTRMFAAEGASYNVRAVSISPGVIATPTTVRFFDGKDPVQSAIGAGLVNKIPSGRPGTSEDIAKVAVFLASDDAAYINGTDVCVDGGFTGVSYRRDEDR